MSRPLRMMRLRRVLIVRRKTVLASRRVLAVLNAAHGGTVMGGVLVMMTSPLVVYMCCTGIACSG